MAIDGIVQTGIVDPAADVATDDTEVTVDIAPGDVQAAGIPIDTVALTIGVTTENV